MKTVSTVIRLATKSDGPKLAQMRWDFHSEDKEPISQTIEEFANRFQVFLGEALDTGKWFVWVAEVEGQIVSHIFVYVVSKVPRPSRTTNAWGYVTNVYTTPNHRGRGVGSKLMEAVVHWARSEALELLLVWPSDDSADFYRRAGFIKSPDAHVRSLDDKN
jgi:GNAT superfamily N-acetyltransferase